MAPEPPPSEAEVNGLTMLHGITADWLPEHQQLFAQILILSVIVDQAATPSIPVVEEEPPVVEEETPVVEEETPVRRKLKKTLKRKRL